MLIRSRAAALAAATLVSLSPVATGCAGEAAPAVAEPALARPPASDAPARFLDAAAYADLVTLDPAFPFGVVGRHAAPGAVLGARWGRHGGPTVTTRSFTTPSDAAQAIRWAIGDAPTASASKQVLSAAVAPGMPAPHFWGGDGLVDLPFGSLAMQAYTRAGAPFAGELLLYSESYDEVVGRAHVNGFYSGAGVSDGARHRIVYSGLSATSAAPIAAQDNGLYASEVCGVAGEAPLVVGCTGGVKLFGWSGFSGPVSADANGNVFVAAYRGAGPGSDAVYGVARAQAFASGAITPGVLAEVGTGGTSSLAAVARAGEHGGWIVAKGYDAEKTAPAWARPYRAASSALTAAGPVVERAIAAASPSASFSVFADDAGGLWVAIEDAPNAWFLELAPQR
jgi:hypothetical protein